MTKIKNYCPNNPVQNINTCLYYISVCYFISFVFELKEYNVDNI